MNRRKIRWITIICTQFIWQEVAFWGISLHEKLLGIMILT